MLEILVQENRVLLYPINMIIYENLIFPLDVVQTAYVTEPSMSESLANRLSVIIDEYFYFHHWINR